MMKKAVLKYCRRRAQNYATIVYQVRQSSNTLATSASRHVLEPWVSFSSICILGISNFSTPNKYEVFLSWGKWNVLKSATFAYKHHMFTPFKYFSYRKNGCFNYFYKVTNSWALIKFLWNNTLTPYWVVMLKYTHNEIFKIVTNK